MLKFVIPLRSASQLTKFKFFMFPLLAAALCATASIAAWRCAVFRQLGVGGRRNMSFFFSLFYSFLSCPFPFFFLFFCLFLFLIILPLFSVSFSSSLGAEKDQKHCNCFIWWPVILFIMDIVCIDLVVCQIPTRQAQLNRQRTCFNQINRY